MRAASGSDCVTGKTQYATRQAALEAAQGAKSRGWHLRPFRCAWCLCFHNGNRRANGSKSRQRR